MSGEARDFNNIETRGVKFPHPPLQPRRNWPTWASNVLITHHILRIWPRRTTTWSMNWKNSWKVAIFRPTRRSLLPRRPGWKDRQSSDFFFEWLAKVRAMG